MRGSGDTVHTHHEVFAVLFSICLWKAVQSQNSCGSLMASAQEFTSQSAIHEYPQLLQAKIQSLHLNCHRRQFDLSCWDFFQWRAWEVIACSCSAASAWSRSLHHRVVNSWRVRIKLVWISATWFLRNTVIQALYKPVFLTVRSLSKSVEILQWLQLCNLFSILV